MWDRNNATNIHKHPQGMATIPPMVMTCDDWWRTSVAGMVIQCHPSTPEFGLTEVAQGGRGHSPHGFEVAFLLGQQHWHLRLDLLMMWMFWWFWMIVRDFRIWKLGTLKLRQNLYGVSYIVALENSLEKSTVAAAFIVWCGLHLHRHALDPKRFSVGRRRIPEMFFLSYQRWSKMIGVQQLEHVGT